MIMNIRYALTHDNRLEMLHFVSCIRKFDKKDIEGFKQNLGTKCTATFSLLPLFLHTPGEH